jgi:hypothetical protein
LNFDFDRASQALLGCQDQSLRHLAQHAGAAITRYLRIAEEALRLDVTAPEATAFRRLFNGYYGVRRAEVWRIEFYSVFENLKSHQGIPDERFALAINQLQERTGRIEASFASKIVATLDPSAPVIDSIVSGFLARYGLQARSAGLAAAIGYYGEMRQVLEELTKCSFITIWANQFDASFAQLEGAVGISPMKKLDFLIWSGAR